MDVGRCSVSIFFSQFFSTSGGSAFDFPNFSFVILGIFCCFGQGSGRLGGPLGVALAPLPSFLLASVGVSRSASVFRDEIVRRSRPLWFEWIGVTDSRECIHY